MEPEKQQKTTLASWQRRMHEVIYEADTAAGKAFDVVLLIVSTQACPNGAAEGHDLDAQHCKFCGARL